MLVYIFRPYLYSCSCIFSGHIYIHARVYFQAIFIFTFVDYESSTYGDYLYPVWADAIGWLLAVVVISPIFIFFFIMLGKDDSNDTVLNVSVQMRYIQCINLSTFTNKVKLLNSIYIVLK